MAVGSSEWYTSVCGDEDQQSTVEHGGWDLDSYFTPIGEHRRTKKSKVSLSLTRSGTIGVLVAMLLAAYHEGLLGFFQLLI